MAEAIKMPKMSDTMEEGVIAAWLKKEGDTVKVGDILAEVETDKATMELEAYEAGTLLHIGAKEKESVPIDAVIAVIGEPGEDISALLQGVEGPPQQQKESLTVATSTTSTPPNVANPEATKNTPNILASPLAKKMAQEKGYALNNIQGSGEGGRIIKRDIEAITIKAQPEQASSNIVLPTTVGEEGYEDVVISPMRKTIAKRLTASKFSAPHFYLTISIAMDQVIAARISINEYAPIKISFNDIIIKAVAMAIRQHPAINTEWRQDKIRHNKHIHVGVAIAIAEGLVVPTIRFADSKSLAAIAGEVKILRQKALSQQLHPKDLEGGTFTISNLGMLGIESFTAIVNPPAACILAVGEVKQIPVVKNGAVVPGHIMKVTLSCDHRVVDGAVGAAFLHTLRQLLEDPRKMLVH
ncbi:MAG: dihydrolipoamide acetyltransferase family protein [Bacteroidota bacterium]